MARRTRVLAATAVLLGLALAASAIPSSAVPAVSTVVSPAVRPDPATVITFLVGLPHSISKLERAAQAVSSPGDPSFRKYLGVKDVAVTYGATTEAERKLETAAAKAGLRATIDATRLFARVSGTVAQWEKVMGQPVQFAAAQAGSAQDGNIPFNTYGFGNSDLIELAPPPAALKSSITWMLPTYMRYVESLDVPGAPREKNSRILVNPGPPTDAPQNGGSPLGPSCLSAEVQPFAFTPSQVSHAYGLAALQKESRTSQPRVAVLSVGGGFAQGDLDIAAKCFGHHAPTVDAKLGLGLDKPIVSLSAESALDLQTVAWAAKNLESVRFVEVVDNDPAFIEAYSMALTAWPTPPDAVTTSWGGCELEQHVVAGSFAAVESLFQFAALVGTSLFGDSGDLGSSACQLSGTAVDDPRPTVQYPASSPFVTAVGGTQLNLGPGNVRVGESVWNDLQYGAVGDAVSTGGPSAVFGAPWYQRPITGSDVRSVPDVVAQAGGGPGMMIYVGGQLIGPVGGTSQSTPLVATGFAAISAKLRAEGKAPLGFVNPWIYGVARHHRDALYDVTIGNNQYPIQYAEQSLNIPACCQAGPGFDAASGLGAPLFNKLLGYVDPVARN
ncbi:MAG: S53 family peptidase [bacterium]|nr:S53 family peptidase [bacterium]